MSRKRSVLVVLVVLVVLAIAFVARPARTVSDTAIVGQAVPVHFENYGNGALLDASTLLHTYAAPGGRFRAAADNSGVVRMIIPVAPDFASPDGISQNSKLNDVRNLTDSKLIEVPGYGYLVDMPSGWTAVFCVGKGMTDSEPKGDDTVAFICQR